MAEPVTRMPAEPQCSARVLMIRPARFGPNAETAASNAFQREVRHEPEAVLAGARREFDALAATLRAHGVEVIVIEDTAEPAKPDAVFPNNWVSFHAGGTAVLYPLLAPSRRAEVRPEVLEELERRGALVPGRRIDLRAPGERDDGVILEGTGSLVLDRPARLAYACLSARTTPAGLARFERALGYRTVAFHAQDARGLSIYHTNVMMSVGSALAVVCLEALGDEGERRALIASLEAGGKTIVPLALAQVDEFAGNLLELRSSAGAPLFVLSARARRALRPDQLAVLARHGRLVTAELETIETHGGGSARCMLAELF
jgi:hypothetical protein